MTSAQISLVLHCHSKDVVCFPTDPEEWKRKQWSLPYVGLQPLENAGVGCGQCIWDRVTNRKRSQEALGLRRLSGSTVSLARGALSGNHTAENATLHTQEGGCHLCRCSGGNHEGKGCLGGWEWHDPSSVYEFLS